jgi:hypothetical protein
VPFRERTINTPAAIEGCIAGEKFFGGRRCLRLLRIARLEWCT